MSARSQRAGRKTAPAFAALPPSLAVAILGLMVAALCGCGQPVPADKLAYVGEWETKTMQLLITADGRVVYNRVRGNGTVKIDAPLKGFDRNNFEVGVGPFTTTFYVSTPPYEEAGTWRMVVDGVELTRTGDAL